jgi:hypothetical protein
MTEIWITVSLLALLAGAACGALGYAMGTRRFNAKYADTINGLNAQSDEYNRRALVWQTTAMKYHRELANAHKGIRRLQRRYEKLKRETGG